MLLKRIWICCNCGWKGDSETIDHVHIHELFDIEVNESNADDLTECCPECKSTDVEFYRY